jgi:tRNA-specific 2-thiouridylase
MIKKNRKINALRSGLRGAAAPRLQQKIYVAMSGGVDSSVSAALLQKAGFDVTGIYMKQWAPEILGKECMWKTDRQDALRVCAKLGIPFLTWDFSKEYKQQVATYMINSYKKGITPNPDVMCNKVIKFGLFFDKAMREGADFIATGHYAQIKESRILNLGVGIKRYELVKAR